MAGSNTFRRFAPEVVQTSAMDCGPAALACLLNGSGLPVSYPRLRELCHTDVDGTSIDTMEELACELGLDAEQVMLPTDCILGMQTPVLPCIAVVRLPSGLTHFVVAWREQFGLVQIMDPATGRRWMSRRQFLDFLYQHAMPVAAEDWLEYARGEDFRSALLERLLRHLPAQRGQRLLDAAYAQNSWQAIADLDALVRLATKLTEEGEGKASIDALISSFEAEPEALCALLPDSCYQVTAAAEEGMVDLHGAVLLKVNAAAQAEAATRAPGEPVLDHVRQSRPVSIFAELKQTLHEAGMGNAVPVLVGVGFAVGLLTLLEGLLFRYLLDMELAQDPVLLLLLGVVLLVPLLCGVLLDRGAYGFALAVGRQIDSRLRIRLLERLPRMRDGYFASRLVSDLAERGHAISELKSVPEFLIRGSSAFARLLWIGVGLAVLAPQSLPLVLTMIVVAVAIPLILFPVIAERDLRTRAHLAALGRINLDALRGAEPIWSHAGQASVKLEHESLLSNWRQTGMAMLRATVTGEAVLRVVLLLLAVALIATYLPPSPLTLGSTLLLAYWALNLPLVAGEFFEVLRLLPTARNVAGRVIELFAPDELENLEAVAGFTSPVALSFRAAGLRRSQIAVLRDVNLEIASGERVALVGASGSGKSSLLATLLGFQSVDEGVLLIDGRAANPSVLAVLRESTVCIDSELYLWNRSILENLLYGNPLASSAFDAALSGAEVKSDLARMDDGLATRVGENGVRLSGGEGQRVRIARGLLSESPSLVLLDEPFRGMDRDQRRRLLRAVTERWEGVTTLFVSHDVNETLAFDRVVVVADGTIVEDGDPRALRDDPSTRYAAMLDAELVADQQLAQRWGRLLLQDRRLEVDRG